MRYLAIGLGETGTGWIFLWAKSEKHFLASGLGYLWPIWVKVEGGVLMRTQTVGSLELQATSSCLLLKVGSQISFILVLFIKVGDSRGGS